ncbi:Nucleotide-diphospho-sugar transferase family protein [Zea mays]|uniref:Nucleotide-diphospho-sugar transferase family protein n=2 Tax=Zea mays TaxID=4577 RepID=A0A1D6I838_MAIZE|nr:Nucleotide-diphospho-sugar transferase family protein [Zea mays]
MKKLHMQAGNSTDHELLELLKRAAMDDRTIIMTFTNEAWTAPGSLLDLFLQSFRLGVRTAPLLKHLIVVAVDAMAYERCQHVHRLCYHLRVDGVDYAAEQSYMQKDYLDMMWRRNRFQARILELGYSFVFTDVDIIWLRNPLLRIPVGADMAMSCDFFYGDNPYDLNKLANGGFVYAKANARMVAFYGSWYESRKGFPGAHEQYVFDQVKQELSARHGVRVQFVDTAYLSGFCELRKDFYRVCTVHANCLVGLQSKLQKLTQVFDEWKQFREKAALLGSNTTALTD